MEEAWEVAIAREDRAEHRKAVEGGVGRQEENARRKALQEVVEEIAPENVFAHLGHHRFAVAVDVNDAVVAGEQGGAQEEKAEEQAHRGHRLDGVQPLGPLEG